MFKKLKELYHKNTHHIGPGIEFARNCIYHISEMKENPGIADYITLGFNCKDDFEDAFGKIGPYGYFADKNWQSCFAKIFHQFLVELLMQFGEIRTVRTDGSIRAQITEIDQIRFGWVINGVNKVDGFFIPTGQQEQVYSVLNKLFWQAFPEGKIIVGLEGDTKELSIKLDLAHNQFVKFKKCNEYAEYITKYQKASISRSILFYGVPGSGKTSLIKGIVYELKARCVRFNDLMLMTPAFVAEMIRVFDPDCIILEDIDHMESEEINDLLDKVEDFNQQKKLILATANEVEKLDNALLRPGRFDETIEINKLDEEVLIKLVRDDREIFEIVKDFPVAFVMELMKRIDVLGKETALDSIEDLQTRIDNIEGVNYSLKKNNMRPQIARSGKEVVLTGLKSSKK